MLWVYFDLIAFHLFITSIFAYIIFLSIDQHFNVRYILPVATPEARPDPIGESEPKPRGRSVLFLFIFRVIKFSFSKVVATRIPSPTRMVDPNRSPVYSDVFIYLIKTFY